MARWGAGWGLLGVGEGEGLDESWTERKMERDMYG